MGPEAEGEAGYTFPLNPTSTILTTTIQWGEGRVKGGGRKTWVIKIKHGGWREREGEATKK